MFIAVLCGRSDVVVGTGMTQRPSQMQRLAAVEKLWVGRALLTEGC